MPITVADNSGVPSDDVSRARVLAIVAARNESQRIAATLSGLARAFPDASVWVADDGSADGTAEIAERAGATVVPAGRSGKGQAMTIAVARALESVEWMGGATRARVRARVTGEDLGGEDVGDDENAGDVGVDEGEDVGDGEHLGDEVQHPDDPIVLLCDGDLGSCASELAALVDAVDRGDADLVVAAFSTRASGGLGIALAFARWAIRRRCGLSTRAPLSGQRAMRAGVLRDVLPFAPGYGMEIAMTIDAVRAGHRILEVPLELSHRPTGRTPAGFAHRGRQLFDCVRVFGSLRGRIPY